jgi:hypothetical protein
MHREFFPEVSNLGASIKSYDQLGEKYIPNIHPKILN